MFAKGNITFIKRYGTGKKHYIPTKLVHCCTFQKKLKKITMKIDVVEIVSCMLNGSEDSQGWGTQKGCLY
jgi:hypothetical protein